MPSYISLITTLGKKSDLLIIPSSKLDPMSLVTETTIQQQRLQEECGNLVAAKKVLSDYYSNYEKESNASKLDKYISEIGHDVNNPFFLIKHNLKSSIETLDMIFVMKQTRLLNLE